MSFGALAAVGACVQIVKTLYEYYNVHSRNKALLDILESFSQNLEISIERLQAREEMLGFAQNDALDSIERDFRKAKEWLLANDKNLRSIWTALQAADKLKDLDDRLTKAFASKMSVAIFSALQDTRAGVARIETTLEGLPTNLETVCKTSAKEAIHEAIGELKAEAYAVAGGGEGPGRGFVNGEAEKIISQLVDQLAEQERLKEDEELMLMSTYPTLDPIASSATSPVPYAPASSHVPASSRGVPSEHSSHLDEPFEPAPSRASSRFSRKKSQLTLASTAMTSEPGDESIALSAALAFSPVDASGADIVDPVLANDGSIYDRWTLVNGRLRSSTGRGEPLTILGDVVQLRENLFGLFPERKQKHRDLRQTYRLATLRLYKSAAFTDLPELLDRLSHVLLYEPTSISLHIRRGYVSYRLRFLEEALTDFQAAVDQSKTGVNGEKDRHKPDVDALRARALTLSAMHRYEDAKRDLEAVLAQSPRDILCLSLRASIAGNEGDVKSARADLAATNAAVRAGKAFRSRLGDEDSDLEYLARGWAYCSVGDFGSAAADMAFAANLRDPADPYAAACQALALIKQEEGRAGKPSDETVATCAAQLEASLSVFQALVEESAKAGVRVSETTSGAVKITAVDAGYPICAYPTLLLRGSARAVQGDTQNALRDLELALRIQPACVREDSGGMCAMAELYVASGDRERAQRMFDKAIAAAGQGARAGIVECREAHGI